jgi:hypothetical protein
MSVACREQVEDVVYCDDFINEVQFYLEEKVKELPPIDELKKKLTDKVRLRADRWLKFK